MAKFRLTNLSKVKSDIKKAVRKSARDPEIREGIGTLIVNDIQANPAGSAGEVTKAFREFFEQYNDTDKKYSRGKINITFTGDLMRDLKKNVKANLEGDTVTYVIEQSDKPHKNLKSGGAFKPKTVKGKTKKGKTVNRQVKHTHKEIGRFVEKKGYDYLDFPQRLLDKLSRFIQNRLRAKIKKNLK